MKVLVFLLPAACLVPIHSSAGQYQQWGGPDRDFSCGTTGLTTAWPEGGPRTLWRRPLGDGYSSIVVDDGRLYTMFRRGDEEFVTAIAPETGRTIWTHRYLEPIDTATHPSGYGYGPRATPVIVADRIFAVGFNGRMHCLNKKTGNLIWSVELLEKYDGSVRRWGYACSPLPYRGNIIVFTGGKGESIVALDQRSGRTIWKRHSFENSYASPMMIDVDGEQQLVCFMAREIVGLDPDTGDLKWKHAHENQWRNNIVTPVWGLDHLLFVSSEGHGGSRVLRLTRSGRRTTASLSWATRKVRISHRNAIRIGDYIYASNGDFGPVFFTALNVKTGEVAWKDRRFSAAGCLEVDGRLILLDEEGYLALVTATPEGLTVHARVKVLEKESWTSPTLVGKSLFLRDRKTILALELP